MQIIKLFPDMLLTLKKPHPCGGSEFRVMRVGSVCRVVCTRCGRDMDIDRLKLERAIKHTQIPAAAKDKE